MVLIKFFLLFLFLFISNVYAKNHSKQFFCIVSQNSASLLNAGANEYLKNSKDKVTIRTVAQVLNMSEDKLQTHISMADTILYISVFGDSVERLLTKKYQQKQQVISLQGDRRLLSLNQDNSNAKYKKIKNSILKKEIKGNEYLSFLYKKQKEFPSFSYYLQARAYWDNRGAENIANLFSFLSQERLLKTSWPKILELKRIRYFLNANASETFSTINELEAKLDPNQPLLFVLDNDKGDGFEQWKVHQSFVENSNYQVVSILSSWGEASFKAVENIEVLRKKLLLDEKAFSIISLHDFVIGGSSGSLQVTKLLEKINVPVLKGLRVLDLKYLEYMLSSEGLPKDSVHYRIAMPELQGIGQAHILAMNDTLSFDVKTGVALFSIRIMEEEIKNILSRAKKWISLRKKDNADKKVAIIFYNHPPGRHNIGADNLNVPKSLFKILNTLKEKGYKVGKLPKNEEALLEILQQKAVNLPNDKKALKQMAPFVNKIDSKAYTRWLETLPLTIQEEMQYGPLAALHERIISFLGEDTQNIETMNKTRSYFAMSNYMEKTIDNLHHTLDGVRSKSRQRAINLLEQLKEEYHALLNKSETSNKSLNYEKANILKERIIDMQIEGIRGWGKAPGKTMVYENKLLLPGVVFGNIFLGPQPPRGWELNEELLHANLSFPPTHQYLAFYHYLKNSFNADAIIHVGRHSTYEFLPRKSVGLSAIDYPSLIIEDIPSIYPYIVDGVGEGIQAKRRGSAIMIDHLTPPLAITELYDNLLELRQLIESAEAATDDNIRKQSIAKLKVVINKANLKDEILESMDEELKVRGIGFDEVDDEFLLHEVGHYLTHLQEEFMPLGLHTFGQNWTKEAIDTMLSSMRDPLKKSATTDNQTKKNLIISPSKELEALFNALDGGFVISGKGNDPIRTKESLPTGRNFYALNGSLIPSQIGYDIGVKLAQKVRNKKEENINKKEAIILWASDTVRDEGAMIAFGFDLLGVKPIWNSRGILNDLEVLPLDKNRTRRYDVLFTSSGLFRDLYGSKLALLDKAVLLALNTSYDEIIRKYPALSLALNSTLKGMTIGGNEPIKTNSVALNWVEEARTLLKQHPTMKQNRVGELASLRVFATAPGSYGAGINRLVERSGAWKDRKELGNVYIKRMGYAYTQALSGELANESFKRQLSKVENTYLGRASNLYGLIDNNDTFDYLGGLNLAIETITGHQPKSFVINHSNTNNLKMDSLPNALLGEIRGRFLNPQWIKPLMKEGYSGARTMGSEFIEYLWGWQVTSPEIITDEVWEDVKAVYVDDKLNLGLDTFLSSNHQVHVQTNILAVMLVAIEKGFWKADEKTVKQLANQFTNNILQYGIPGSGHTHAHHPIYDFIKPLIDEKMATKLEEVLEESKITKETKGKNISHIQEIEFKEKDLKMSQEKEKNMENKEDIKEKESYLEYLIGLALFLLFLGFFKSIVINNTTNKEL